MVPHILLEGLENYASFPNGIRTANACFGVFRAHETRLVATNVVLFLLKIEILRENLLLNFIFACFNTQNVL